MSVGDTVVNAKHLKRKHEKLRRQKRSVETIRTSLTTTGSYISKRDMLRQVKEKMEISFATGVKFCFDCAFETDMSDKECGKFAQQLCRAYGANKKSISPLSLHLVNFDLNGKLGEICRKKCAGFERYKMGFHSTSPAESFNKTKIVYLSPEASTALLEIDNDAVYVAGGLVDEQLLKGKSLYAAAELGANAVRLPIDEFAPSDWCPQNKAKSSALPINTVVEILLTFMESQDWRIALEKHLPRRFRTVSL